MGRIILAAIAVLALAGAAHADFQGGLKAYERGDYPAALKAWRAVAEAGNPRVQHIIASLYAGAEGVPRDDVLGYVWLSLAVANYPPGTDRKRAKRSREILDGQLVPRQRLDAWLRLGQTYETGSGAARDPVEAARWYRRAVEQGSAEAEGRVVALYLEGEGVPEDAREALWWHRLAAKRGIARAQYLLGTLYELGKAVGRDDGQAARWYRKAADQGLADAQFNLAFMYAQGQGVPRDDITAHMWFSLAAAGYPPGTVRDSALKNRDGVAEGLSPKDLKKARRMAEDWRAARGR